MRSTAGWSRLASATPAKPPRALAGTITRTAIHETGPNNAKYTAATTLMIERHHALQRIETLQVVADEEAKDSEHHHSEAGAEEGAVDATEELRHREQR